MLLVRSKMRTALSPVISFEHQDGSTFLENTSTILYSCVLYATSLTHTHQQPVIPAAIEQDILIAMTFSPSESDRSSVVIGNTSSKYPSKTFSLESSNETWEVADGLGTGWTAYAKASIAEVIAQTSGQPVSMQWLVDGVIPEGAGLSVSFVAQAWS